MSSMQEKAHDRLHDGLSPSMEQGDRQFSSVEPDQKEKTSAQVPSPTTTSLEALVARTNMHSSKEPTTVTLEPRASAKRADGRDDIVAMLAW
jgi:hypothetical protein